MSRFSNAFQRNVIGPFVVTLGCVAAWVAAAETIPFQTAGGEEGILVLRTGRIVEGRIAKNGDSYSVRQANGEMFVPAAMVKLQSRDLKDAYHKLHAGLPAKNSADEQVSLARWCLTNQMFNEARQELRDVLATDPSRTDVRDMLRKLNEALDPRPVVEKAKTDRETQAAKGAGFRSDEIESLGGLSRESAQAFVRRIQPILLNNCAAAGCHAPDAGNGFRLQRVTVGSDSSRQPVARNLASVLRYVTPNDPRASPLLTVPQKNHGHSSRPLFGGARGGEHAAELRKWVVSLVKEGVQTGTSAAAAVKPKAAPKEPKPMNPLADAVSDDESDPFDPAHFNRSATKPRP